MSETRAFETEADVLRALRARFAAPEWAFLCHVRNGTGYTRPVTRTADAIVMSLWPSRGLEVHGIEVKVSRSDWTREMKDPAKAEEIFKFCDRWWLAVGSENIVQPGELPPTWGLLAPRGGKLVARVEAPKLEPQPLTRVFLAACLRNASEYAPGKAEIDAAVAAVRKEERDMSVEALKRAEESHRQALDEVRKEIADFEAASGVKISRWQAGRVGEAVKQLLAHGPKGLAAQMRFLATNARNIADEAASALAQIEAMKTDAPEVAP